VFRVCGSYAVLCLWAMRGESVSNILKVCDVRVIEVPVVMWVLDVLLEWKRFTVHNQGNVQ